MEISACSHATRDLTFADTKHFTCFRGSVRGGVSVTVWLGSGIEFRLVVLTLIGLGFFKMGGVKVTLQSSITRRKLKLIRFLNNRDNFCDPNFDDVSNFGQKMAKL